MSPIQIVPDPAVPPGEMWITQTLGYRVELAPPAGIRLVVERKILGKIVGLGVGVGEPEEPRT
jgi:hypothetical protein